jgi:hypothetical protein
MFWLGVLIMLAIVVGLSVFVGRMLSRQGPPEKRSNRHQQMMALKASGALRHRKSNRP